MQVAICCGSKEIESPIEGSVDHGRGNRVAERESDYWLLGEGSLDLQAGTSSPGQETFTL